MKFLRLHGTHPDALPQLALLGVGCGLLAGAVMIAFRMAFEALQAGYLPGGDPENYEALSAAARFLLPVAGGLLVGLVFQLLPWQARHVGPAHVLDRLESAGARLPAGNALAQFGGAVLSIASGHSVGREGPAIHLGAAVGSLAGQYFALPEGSLRVMAACGVAAAIAASFNTPLAGVAFAMEALAIGYSVLGFAPVILAAVSATALARLAYGADPAFMVPTLALRSLWELPYIVAVGLVVGVFAAAYTGLLEAIAPRAARLPFWLACTLAGVLVGLCALAAPQVMGIGYDTVGAALLGSLALGTLVSVALLKLLATTVGIGLGLPGGLIGPMLVIGATAGGALGMAGAWVAPDYASSAGFYALIGMGAMMGGTLHAPLAALTAMLELTGNPNILWPGMLAVIASYFTSRELFRRRPVFEALLRAHQRAP